MTLVWNPFGALGVVTGCLVLAMAGLVYFTRPDRTANRRLAMFLVLEGVVGLTGVGLMFLSARPTDAYAWQAPTVLAMLAAPYVYLRFVATLDSPLAAPLRNPWMDRALMVLAALVPLAWFVRPELFVATMLDVWFVPWELLPGPGWLRMFEWLAAVYLYGFTVAVHAYLRAPHGTVARRRARMFAIAFGVRDVTFSFFLVGPIFIPGLTYDTQYGGLFWAAGPSITALMFVPLLTYAILRTQLFDIDLRIKVALRRSTVAALVAGLFLVVTESVEAWFDVRSQWLAIALAVAIALAFRPIQRAANHLVDRAMPGVEDTPTYRAARAADLYRGAVESVLVDGHVTERERAVLSRLQTDLGLSLAEATLIEQDVARTHPT